MDRYFEKCNFRNRRDLGERERKKNRQRNICTKIYRSVNRFLNVASFLALLYTFVGDLLKIFVFVCIIYSIITQEKDKRGRKKESRLMRTKLYFRGAQSNENAISIRINFLVDVDSRVPINVLRFYPCFSHNRRTLCRLVTSNDLRLPIEETWRKLLRGSRNPRVTQHKLSIMEPFYVLGEKRLCNTSKEFFNFRILLVRIIRFDEDETNNQGMI